jgi:hypothetical protein
VISLARGATLVLRGFGPFNSFQAPCCDLYLSGSLFLHLLPGFLFMRGGGGKVQNCILYLSAE